MSARSFEPVTHYVEVERALRTLDGRQMLALSAMFERWALTETKISDEQRTKLIQWSADYEAIAAFAGPDWIASEPADRSLLAFIARREVAADQRNPRAGE